MPPFNKGLIKGLSESMKKIFLIFVIYIIVYYSQLVELIRLWSKNEDYGHGYAILPLSLWLIWKKREQISGAQGSPPLWSYLLFALWVVFYLFGTIGDVATVMYGSMVLFLMAAISLLLDGTAVRVLLFPLLFIVFMFPIPAEIYTRITNPLMLIASTMSANLLTALNVPILQEGNLLFLPNYRMEVVNACSGIRSLIAIMALALFMGYLFLTSNILRMLTFAISIPIAIFGNIFRIAVTAMLAYFVSTRAAESYNHLFAGLTTFFLSLTILYACMEALAKCSKKKEPSSL